MDLLLRALISCLASSAVNAATPTKTLIIIGDSLTVGAGVDPSRAYPALLRQKIEAAGLPWNVEPRGINGSVSASAAARMTEALAGKPDLIMLALGGNDGLRQIPLAEVEANLGCALALAKTAHVRVLLAGLRAPPGFPAPPGRQIEEMFERLARTHDATLWASMLEGVTGVPGMNLPDGIHPAPAGHAVIAARAFEALRPLLTLP